MAQADVTQGEAAPATTEDAPDASPSLYIKNLNEKIKLDGTVSLWRLCIFELLPSAEPRQLITHASLPSSIYLFPCPLLLLGSGHWRSITVLKKSLKAIFGQYGEVLDIVAHANIRMRGQAFVIFEDSQTATKAMSEVQSFPLYGKPMV